MLEDKLSLWSSFKASNRRMNLRQKTPPKEKIDMP
jgi:hypothetical protein